ncbi:MAG TPA: DUF1232 domain-containing protein [Quisquiliibacterium sp.]|nr:DUF1232 domain-containing protein [Quisquiliibacterium sp.]
MWFLKLRRLARKAGREALILFFAARHPETPTPLKLAAAAALVYLLSPVDLIPDVPLIGFVDDLLVLSLGLPMLVRKLPPRVLADTGARADRVLAALGLRTGGAAGAGASPGQADVEVEVEVAAAPRQARRATGAARPRARARGGAERVSDAKIVSEVAARPKGRRRGAAGA